MNRSQSTKYKLKSCPFCGSKAEIEEKYTYNSDIICWVECIECGCRTDDSYIENIEKLVDVWNTRVEEHFNIKELVDKATPKKPYRAEWGYRCPTCNGYEVYDYEYDNTFEYCSNCGQKLDRSEVKENE